MPPVYLPSLAAAEAGFVQQSLWRDPRGMVHFDEVKFDPSSHLTKPQMNGVHEFGAGKFTVTGARAIEAGLIPGAPLGGISAKRFGGWTLRGFGGADPNRMMERLRAAWRVAGERGSSSSD
jgi:hypothetical protein